MMVDDLEFLPLRVIRVGPKGKRTFDPRDKRLLVEACRQPGASVAGMALRAGVNANQLRNWIALDEARRAIASPASAMPAVPTAFVPVVEVGSVALKHESSVMGAPSSASACQAPTTLPPLARLKARLPNGATVELQCTGGDAALVAAMVQALVAR